MLPRLSKQAHEVQTAADIVFKALADSRRRGIPDRLRMRGGLTLFELCEGRFQQWHQKEAG